MAYSKSIDGTNSGGYNIQLGVTLTRFCCRPLLSAAWVEAWDLSTGVCTICTIGSSNLVNTDWRSGGQQEVSVRRSPHLVPLQQVYVGPEHGGAVHGVFRGGAARLGRARLGLHHVKRGL